MKKNNKPQRGPLTRVTVDLDAGLWHSFVTKVAAKRAIRKNNQAINMVMEEWLQRNQEESDSNQPVPKPISPVPSAGKTTVENARDANVTLTALAQQHDAITLETLAKMMEGLVSEVRIVKAAIADAGSTKRAVRRPRKRKAPAKKKLDAAANLLANAKKQLG